MLSIKQWQTPCHGQTTRVYNQFAPFKCHGCTGHTRPTSASMVSCSRGDDVVLLCSNCWDEEDWICTDCHTKPDDSDVLGCEQCGQWAHIGCQLKSSRDNYICNDCLNTSVMPVVIPQMKVEIYDLTKSLKNTRTQLETKTAQLKKMTDVHKTMTNDMKALHTDMSETKADIIQVHSHYVQKITTLKSTLTSEAQAQTQEMLHLNLSNARLKKTNMELVKLVKATNKRVSSVGAKTDKSSSSSSSSTVVAAGKKRKFRVQAATDETREKRKNAAAKRRKKQYAETAKEAKKHFDMWFKEEVTVDKELKNKRIGKEELEEHYVEWHKKKKIADRLLLSTKAKKEGMHFSTEVLKRINATLKRKKNNQVTFMDNGASVACFPYISHKKIKRK